MKNQDMDEPVRKARAEYLGPARRRPIVLDAALELFAEGGFADASMEALARKAGTTKPVLYDCFPGGKQEVYFALLDREDARFVSHVMGVLSTSGRMKMRDALASGISAFLEYADVNPTAFRVIFGAPGTADPVIVKRVEQIREVIVRTIVDRSVVVDPGHGTPARVEMYARAIVALSESLARWWISDKPIDRETLVTWIVDWMMKGFEGVLPPESLDVPRFTTPGT